MGADRRLLAPAALGIALMVGGCGPASLDFGTPVNMHIWTTPATVELDAPGWFADVSAVYLCPAEPPRLPDGAADRVGWTPGDACAFMGSYPSRDGLTLSMPVDDIDAARRPAFEAAADWYLVLLDLDGDRVGAAIRSQFHAPSGPPAT